MYRAGDQVLYGIHGVCRILQIEVRMIDRKAVEYYVLEPLEQPGARFLVPTQNQAAVAKLRPILNAEELTALLESEEARKECWIDDENLRKQRYRDLIGAGDRAALVAMVRSLHRRKEVQSSAGRKLHLCDETFLRDAEKLLNAEFSMILGIPAGQVGSYVQERMKY